ncbi:tetratricopeptide repeat protein [Succinatimonas hippei]|uniref:tetratricopeptide repeat protein n=1 Tax=Succinatimonas hippei TaxID=626938 RepID=UPI002011673D|nr:tetratricopeptide repeat protein [Succinatimonas hippei]MCL1603324.1 tetratricopeptide repeat protein [Succinatimonas hippei]
MQILEKEKISALIQLGFAGCAKGQIFQARRLFEGLLCADSELVGAKIGLAFSYIVVDDFDKADQILDELLVSHSDDADVKAMKVFSLSLQKKSEEAKKLASSVDASQQSAYNLCQDALNLLDR